MPGVTGLLGHVDGVTRPQAEDKVLFPPVARLCLPRGVYMAATLLHRSRVPLRAAAAASVAILCPCRTAHLRRFVARRNHEQGLTPHAQAHQPFIDLLADVAVHHHGVARGVKVDDGGLGERLREQLLQEPPDVGRKGMWWHVRVNAVGPVVLASQREPVETMVEDFLDA